jgi:hypothetical protein
LKIATMLNENGSGAFYVTATAMVPSLLFEFGWTYKDQPNSGYRAPSGTYTVGDPHYGVPFKHDQDIILYLANRAAQGEQSVRAHYRDISRWLGASWRNKATLRRLRRVLSCVIFRPDQRGTFSPFRVGTFIAERQDGFIVELAPEFMDEVSAGAVYSLDIFRQLRRRAAPTRYYLYLVWLCHQASNQAEHDPYGCLPRAESPHKSRQRLQEWDEQVRALWPECPFQAVALKVHAIVRSVARVRHAEPNPGEHGSGGGRAEEAARPGRARAEEAARPGRARTEEAARPGRDRAEEAARPGRARAEHQDVARRGAIAVGNGEVPRRNRSQDRRPGPGTRAPPPDAWQHISDFARGIHDYAKMLTAFAGSAIGPPRQRSTTATPRGSPTPQAAISGGQQRPPKRQR